MSKTPGESPFDHSTLEMQPPPSYQKENIFVRIYSRPFRELSPWEILLRFTVALLVGAAIGAIIGVIVRFA
jgi:hypothetical protein